MMKKGYSHSSAGYSDSVSKDTVRTKGETSSDSKKGLSPLKTGLNHKEPMRSEYIDPNGLDYLGGMRGRR